MILKHLILHFNPVFVAYRPGTGLCGPAAHEPCNSRLRFRFRFSVFSLPLNVYKIYAHFIDHTVKNTVVVVLVVVVGTTTCPKVFYGRCGCSSGHFGLDPAQHTTFSHSPLLSDNHLGG